MGKKMHLQASRLALGRCQDLICAVSLWQGSSTEDLKEAYYQYVYCGHSLLSPERETDPELAKFMKKSLTESSKMIKHCMKFQDIFNRLEYFY